jgi:4-oxalocrotonate tautomerase
MPYVNLKMYPGRTDEQKQEVANRIIRAVMEVCNVPDAANVPVIIEEVAPENWGTQVKPEVEAKKEKLYTLKA